MAEKSPDALDRARTRGLRVGFAIEPPYAFVDSAGEPTGESPETLRHAARRLGIGELQWFPLPFHELIPALHEGRIDVIAAGLFLTPERSREVLFSRPTVCVRPVLVTRRAEGARAGSTSGRQPCEECRIAVIDGSVEQRSLADAGGPERELVVVPDMATGVVAVTKGSADAFAISAPTARRIVDANPALMLEAGALPARLAGAEEGCAALAFRPADEELTEALDSVLYEFVGSSAQLALLAPFGFTRAELPCEGSPGKTGRVCSRRSGNESP